MFLKELLKAMFNPSLHTHSCQCGLVWEHEEGGEYEHTCPGCGEQQFRKSWNSDYDPEDEKPEVTVSMLPRR